MALAVRRYFFTGIRIGFAAAPLAIFVVIEGTPEGPLPGLGFACLAMLRSFSGRMGD